MLASEQSPDTVRVLLTGQADFNTAVEAINHGRIYRFLNKPCSSELLASTYDPQIVRALENYVGLKPDTVVRSMPLMHIPDNAVFAEDVTTLDQEVLIGAGGEMSPAVRMRLQNYVQTGMLRDSFQIQVAAGKQAANPTVANAVPVDFSA